MSIQHNHLPMLAIVIPCYNEELVLRETAKRLLALLEELTATKKIDQASFLYFIDDGSKDQTWNIIAELHNNTPRVKGLKLARNFGHQSALLAGLLSVKQDADCVISMDADLQQDEKVIIQFLEKYNQGAEIVFGIRNDRQTDTFFKKYTAVFFYNLMHLLGVKLIKNHADFRLMSRKALNSLEDYHEYNIFLRGIVLDLGFKSEKVYFDVFDRFAGSSKYSFKKMLSLALNGITSFSVVPLRMVTLFGFLTFLFSLLMASFVLFQRIIGRAIPGWASTVLPIYTIGGVQIMSLGLLGEYIGKIYKEIKARPRFVKDIELK